MSMKRFAPKTGNPRQKSRDASRKLTRTQDSKQDSYDNARKRVSKKMKRRRILANLVMEYMDDGDFSF
jgi:hypothetical protein